MRWPCGASCSDLEGDDLPVVAADFCVQDEQTANWVVLKILQARAYAQRVTEWAELERRRALREERFFLLRYGPELQAWAGGQLAQRGGRMKSISLPAGRIGFRKQGAKLEVDDEAAALQWAKTSLPEAVVVCESVSKSRLNDHVLATGEVPDGVHVEPAGQKFYVQ